jgi:hypothetical protein
MDRDTGDYRLTGGGRMIIKYQRYTGFILGLFILAVLVLVPGSLSAETFGSENDQTPSSKTKKTVKSGTTKYKGEPGNFIFNEADLKHVLLFFARTYKLNIVIDPGISGKVTCRLIDVPWDQALDLILKQHGLALIEEKKSFRTRKLKKN